MTPVRQPTPSVTEHDVERIVRRDYPATVAAEVLELIATASVREKPRVVLACLKIASGNLDRLKANLASASGYYRDISEYLMAASPYAADRRGVIAQSIEAAR